LEGVKYEEERKQEREREGQGKILMLLGRLQAASVV